METKLMFILSGIGISLLFFVFFVLKLVLFKQNQSYEAKISRILTSEENKVKGQFD